ncbi:MAG: ABC transporter ATP-binding protein, partial [Eubacterium sp.]
MAIVSCKNLSFKYPTGDFYALKDVSFEIQQGDFVLVMGKSASGKSTLLRLMKKEIAPAGEISGSMNISAKAGFVPQNVEENIVTDKVRSELSFALSNMGMKSDDIELKVSEAASYFNLSSKLDRNISELSGGEKQILNLAAVMIMNPDILILDEPVSQLDPVSAEKFISMVKRLNSDFSTTVIITEHSSKGLFDYADKIMMLEQGSLSFCETPAESIRILKAQNSDMLDFVPVEMRLFDGVNTVKDCRDAVKRLNIKSLPAGEIKDDTALKIKNISFAYKKGED